MFRLPICFLSAFALLFLTSCEDEEMAAEAKVQQQRIEELRGELALVKDDFDETLSKDPSRKLEEQEFAIDDLKGVISDLEEELKLLQADKAKAEKSFLDYKKKYPINE